LSNKNSFYDDVVAEQYQKWVYPRPIENLETLSNEYRDKCDPSMVHMLYWPTQQYPEGMDILVAGCGSNQAAYFAFKNPTANVIGIDVSHSSLEHEEFLKKKHELNNLSLYKMAIEETEALGQEFDLIVASGVIHHLEDPLIGMKALKKLLKLEGVLAIMLYAKYGRTGVYMMQEVFQILELEQTKEHLEVIKTSLNALSPDHFANFYIKAAPDLDMDASIVDTFLHRRDQAYSVEDVLNLVETSGLSFQGWMENGLYHPDGQIDSDHLIYNRIMNKEKGEVWRIMELVCGRIFKHEFVVCRKDRPEKSYVIDFSGDDFFDYVPIRRISKLSQSDKKNGIPARIGRPPIPQMPLDNNQILLFNQIDGNKTIQECMDRSGLTGKPSELKQFTKNFISSMWRLGFLLLKIP
jgi:SAM-dependent methyltransferase